MSTPLTLSDFAFKAEKKDTTVEVTIAAADDDGRLSEFGRFTMPEPPQNVREIEQAVARFVRDKVLENDGKSFEYVGTLRRF